MNGILSYTETLAHGCSAGDLLCQMVGGLFCEVVFDFLVEGILELLFGAF